uniref:Uncharacterized protein n=1 Tax=Steinernema glaseri TaxID=37863 RepID=A0A1I8AUF9_9BILA
MVAVCNTPRTSTGYDPILRYTRAFSSPNGWSISLTNLSWNASFKGERAVVIGVLFNTAQGLVTIAKRL